MAETALHPAEPPKALHLDWIMGVVLSPREAFTRLAPQTRALWLTPILVLSLAALLLVVAAAPMRREAAAATVNVVDPTLGKFSTAEQQGRYEQAIQTQQGPVSIYVFPALVTLGKVWLGWLVVSWLMHLVLTLLGGRSSPIQVLNIVAWGALPFALRDIVRSISAFSTHSLVSNPGLSGFAGAGAGWMHALLVGFLSLVDIYIIWHILLLFLGVRSATGLPAGKSLAGVLTTILIALVVQAGFTALLATLGGMSVSRPFFIPFF